AAARIELVWGGNGTGGAGGNTGRTTAAVGTSGFVQRQRQVGEDLAEEEVRAGVARDQVGVFADPADTGLAREGLLEHGPGVDEHAITHRPDARDDVVGQSLQGIAQHLVIVAAEGVARHVAGVLVGQRLHRVARAGGILAGLPGVLLRGRRR